MTARIFSTAKLEPPTELPLCEIDTGAEVSVNRSPVMIMWAAVVAHEVVYTHTYAHTACIYNKRFTPRAEATLSLPSLPPKPMPLPRPTPPLPVLSRTFLSDNVT
jgi:hypothetical protein